MLPDQPNIMETGTRLFLFVIIKSLFAVQILNFNPIMSRVYTFQHES